MDKDISVLIIHTLINQLGLHMERDQGARESWAKVEEKRWGRDSRKKRNESEEIEWQRRCEREEAGALEYITVGFLCAVIHGQ